MKSRTSFCKLTTFKKDLTRFAPVWGLYLIGMLLVLVETTGYLSYDSYAESVMANLIQSFGIVNLIYAGVIAATVFGDLYNTRMCYSLHTQPARRETLLLSHLAAGILFSLVPNLAASLFLMTQLEEYWFLALYWLLAVTLQFLFYYGVAAVSAMLTGHRFAMLLVYAGIQFVSMLVYWIADTIYMPQMEGVVLNLEPFSELCPTVALADLWEFFEFEGITVPDPVFHGEYTTFYEYVGLADGWGYMAILAAVGLAMMGLAVLLYRLRHLEVAGDFVAFPKLKSVACVVMTVCIGGVFAFVGEEMLGDGLLLWLIVGLIVGWFGSLMLLERRVKVFRGKAFVGLGILAAVLFGSFLLVAYDVFGVVHWMPQVQEVKSVTLANYYNSGYDYDLYYGNRLAVELTEDEDIAKIIEAHEDILEHLDERHDESKQRVVLIYELENGRKVTRSYLVPTGSTGYAIVSDYFYTPQNTLGYTDWESYVAGVEYLAISGAEIPQDMYRTFLEALRTDCENGFVVFNSEKEAEHWVDIQYVDAEGRHLNRYLQVLPGAEQTIALMKSPEMILGYRDWDKFLAGIENLDVFGKENSFQVQTDRIGLLEALRKDAENGDVHLGYYTEDCLYEINLTAIQDGQWSNRYLTIDKYAENTLQWIDDYLASQK